MTPIEVPADGIEAPYVDVAAVASADRRGDCGEPCLVLFDWSSGPWVLLASSPQRIYTVRHPSATVFVILEAPASELDAWAGEVQPIIDSIRFGQP